jgi:hypothetical protein
VNLRLSDQAYTERLASFLRSLGQTAVIAGPGLVDLSLREENPESARLEVEIYLRVWRVLYPDAEVSIQADV